MRVFYFIGLMAVLGLRAEASESFRLFDNGLETIVDYEKYGTFSDRGTPQYRYYIKDREGLARAVGEGIYPKRDRAPERPFFSKNAV